MKLTTKNNQSTPSTITKKTPSLSWKIEISTEKMVRKLCKFTTTIGADNLEEAHRMAVERAEIMEVTDPNNTVYMVTDIRRA